MGPWLFIGEIVVCARVTIPSRMEHVKKVRRLSLISFPRRSCSMFNAAVPSSSTLCLTTGVQGKVADHRLGIRLRALRVLTPVLTKLSVSIVVMTRRSGDILPSSQGGPTPKWDK